MQCSIVFAFFLSTSIWHTNYLSFFHFLSSILSICWTNTVSLFLSFSHSHLHSHLYSHFLSHLHSHLYSRFLSHLYSRFHSHLHSHLLSDNAERYRSKIAAQEAKEQENVAMRLMMGKYDQEDTIRAAKKQVSSGKSKWKWHCCDSAVTVLWQCCDNVVEIGLK